MMFSGDEEAYRTSYESLDVHELMLRDEPRTRAYAQYIADNQELFIDKIVVDVGAGTGILSLFAAKAGAKQVYAIEASNVIGLCAELVKRNGLEGRITVLPGRAEEVQLPGDIKADVLISEWMGFYLLHESMLSSIIIARDRLLSPDHGIMVPSAASIYACPVSMKSYTERNSSFWKNFYGFDFGVFAEASQCEKSSRPLIVTIPQTECLAEPHLVVRLELAFVDAEDVKNISAATKFVITKNDVLRGIAVFFDVEFDGPRQSVLSTAPGQPATHWEQTVIKLPDALLVSKGEEVRCNLLLSQDETQARRYNITVEMPDPEDGDDDDDDVSNDGDYELDNEDVMMVDENTMAACEKIENDLNGELETMIRNTMSKPA